MEIKEIIQIALIALAVYLIMGCVSHVKEGFNRYASLPGANNLVLTDADGNMSSIQFPKGMIMIWKGSVNNVPEGWALCDGTKDTPDLRGRFVLGANPTDWSASKDATLSVNQIDQKGGAESVKLETKHMPPHSHGVRHDNACFKNGGCDARLTMNGGGGFTGPEFTSSVGGGEAHSIMPPYYVLAYIMKM